MYLAGSSLLERSWTSPQQSGRKRRCGGARVIWQKRRGSRIRGVGPGGQWEETRYISPTNGIAYMASIQKRACPFGRNDCSAFIRRIEPRGKGQLIEQSVKSRNTKWNSESFFRMARSN